MIIPLNDVRRSWCNGFPFWCNHSTDYWSDCFRFVDDNSSIQLFEENERRRKEKQSEQVSGKQVLISLLIAIICFAIFVFTIDDIAHFLAN